MEISNPDLIKLRFRVLVQYGVNLDETSLSILSVLQDDICEKLTKQNQKLEEAVSSIQRSKKSLEVDHNHPRWQAFWFGMGKWGIASILFIILIGVYTQFYISEQHKKKYVEDWCLWYKYYYDETKGMSKNAAEKWLYNHPMPAQ